MQLSGLYFLAQGCKCMYSGMNFLPFFISCEEHGDAEQFQKWYNEEVSQEKGCVKTK